ncbi:MAG: Ig-like domain-containing protein [Candidatus Symbiothrix sp.]|jgi:hypothetical protein|nr:Ig-like domain-containing protein [Candidatus Symbiothrix sp.]
MSKKIYLLLLTLLLLGSTSYAQSTVFAEDFLTAESLNSWTQITTQGKAWVWFSSGYTQGNTGKVICNAHETLATDSWLVSQGLTLKSGVTYTLTFRRRVLPSSGNLEVKIANAADAVTLGSATALFTYNNSGTSYTLETKTFTVPSNGTYYLGVHCFSPANASVPENPTDLNYYVAIDNIQIEAPAEKDAGVTAIVRPVTGVNLSDAETVEVKVKNFGSESLSNVTVKYEVNSTVIGTYVISAIASGTEITHEFTDKADLSAGGSYTIKAYTLLTDDEAPANDAKTVTISNTVCSAITAPWSESFSNATFPPSACWLSTSPTNNLWKHSTSGGYPDCIPQDGDGGMIYYNGFLYNNTIGYLTLPAVSVDADLRFTWWVYRNSDVSGDGGPGHAEKLTVYVSTTKDIADAVITKTIYRHTTLEPVETEGDNWYQYSIDIPKEASTVIRYIILEGVGTFGNNLYVDNLHLELVVPYNAGVTAIVSPISGLNKSATETVTVKVKNFGTSELTSIPVKYQVNDGAVVSEEIASLAVGEEIEYPFTTKADLSAEATYVIKVYTDLAADVIPQNDTAKVSVVNKVVPVKPAAWTESFDADLSENDGWTSTSTNTKYWEVVQSTQDDFPSPVLRDGGALFYNAYWSPGGNKAVLVSPQFTVTSEQEVSIWIYRAGYSNDGVNIYANATGVIGAEEQPILSLVVGYETPTATATAESAEGWYQYHALIPAIEGGKAQLILEAVSAYSQNIYLDDLAVGPAVPDAKVSDLAKFETNIYANLTNAEAITVKVKNTGTQTLTEIPVAYSVNGDVKGTGSITANLVAGSESEAFTFEQKADFSAEGDYIVKVYTVLPGDINEANDTLTVTVSNYICNSISTFPYDYDFSDPFLSPCFRSNHPTSATESGEFRLQSSLVPEDNVYIISPELGTTAAAKVISYKIQATTVDAKWELGYTTTAGESDIANFTGFVEHAYPIPYGEPGNGNYVEFADTVPANAAHIAIKNISGQTIYIDDLKIDYIQDVVSTNPVEDAPAAAINQPITLTFSKDIVPLDVTLVTLKAGETIVDIAVDEGSGTSKVLTITPDAPLAYNTIYTVTVPAATIEGFGGYSFSFTTESAPEAKEFFPTKGAEKVEVNSTTAFTVQFDKSIAGSSLEGITINEEPITPELKDGNYSQKDIPSSKLIFTRPPLTLDYNTEYTINIPASAINGLEEDITDWTFTTEETLAITAKIPAENEPSVALDAEIAITFNKNVSVWNGSGVIPIPERPVVTITDNDKNVVAADFVPPVGIWGGKKVVITHDNLLPGKQYTVSIPAEVIPSYKAQVSAEPITWKFKTVDIKYASSSPANGVSDIALDATVTVTFDKDINTYGEPNLSQVKILDQFGGEVSGVDATSEGATITIAHDAFSEGLEYQVVIPKTAVKGLYSDVNVYFTTFETPLAVDTYIPAKDAEDVAIDAEIALEFNKNIFIGIAFGVAPKVTINGSNEGVVAAIDGFPIPSRRLVIAHAPLEYNTVYEVVVEAGYLQGLTANVPWSFTTRHDVGIDQIGIGSLYAANRELHVSNYQSGTSVSVYTVAGNLLTTQKVADKELVINLVQGAYIVNVQSEGKTTIHKVLVK